MENVSKSWGNSGAAVSDEHEVHPPTTAPNASSVRESTAKGVARWLALTTRSRHEKQVDARLKERGYEAYLPLADRESRWHDRVKVVQWPIFPGYIFARLTLADLAFALSTPGVADVVRQGGSPVAIGDEEIENVRRFTHALNQTGFQPTPALLVEAGERVRVTARPFNGVEGIVVEQRGRRRALLVGLRAIGQGVKVEVETAGLKVIGV